MKSIISVADFRAIKRALKRKEDKNFFQKLITKKEVVPDEQITKKTVRLNSLVYLYHSVLNKVLKFRIVLPSEADLSRRKVSVFAPISMAILGSSEKESVRTQIEGLTKELRILKVVSR
jgi:regulator of nucleoside diphosphate kinase